jgi:CheY-like chemotaxis protein
MLKKNILLVEDEPIIRRVHRLFLEKMGFQVDIAVNGMQAIERCLHGFYHLIILDGGLPDMTGLEVGKKIRSLEKNKQTLRKPILLLSAYSSGVLKQWCKEAELDSFAIKPIRYDDLFFLLDSYFNNGTFSVNDKVA